MIFYVLRMESGTHHTMSDIWYFFTHWGRTAHIWVNEIVIIGSDNGLSPGRRQAIIWTNAGILVIGPLGISFSEILFEINTLSFKEMHMKLSSAKWRLFRLLRWPYHRVCLQDLISFWQKDIKEGPYLDTAIALLTSTINYDAELIHKAVKVSRAPPRSLELRQGQQSSMGWLSAAAQRTHGVIITASLRQNDVAASFWRNNGVIITPWVHWERLSGKWLCAWHIWLFWIFSFKWLSKSRTLIQIRFTIPANT